MPKPGISRRNERELVLLSQEGDSRATNRLVSAHTAFIVQTIREFTFPSWVNMEDVLQEGRFGMMDAIRRFDPDSGYRLCTYAKWRIKKAIVDYMTLMGYPLKIPFADIMKLKKIINRFDMGLSPEPDKDDRIIQSPKNINIQNLLSGAMSIHPTIHSSNGERGEYPDTGSDYAIKDSTLSTPDISDGIVNKLFYDAITEKISKLTIAEGVMLGQYLGIYGSHEAMPIRHISGERSRIVKNGEDGLDVMPGISGFGLECGETYNDCSRRIKQSEAKLKNILADFVGIDIPSDYLENTE